METKATARSGEMVSQMTRVEALRRSRFFWWHVRRYVKECGLDQKPAGIRKDVAMYHQWPLQYLSYCACCEYAANHTTGGENICHHCPVEEWRTKSCYTRQFRWFENATSDVVAIIAATSIIKAFTRNLDRLSAT